jgi:hypothetical protein
MRTMIERSGTRRAIGYAGFLGMIWIVAAGIQPTTTYHLAPLLVAATLPLVLVSEEPEIAIRGLITAAATGAGLALVVTGVLTATGWLRGPSLLPIGGGTVESVTFALMGGAFGLLVALLRRRG